ncbi:elongation factor 1-alpha C-terminal domain-related protein [Amycolatopsis vastitatis]|uniref:elongation factor 1-alpha C-terminal domain-related protein n=1 Tax=Amycolatopsis vastitatis TaxID=1905142 RepID=UPI003F6AA25B
MHCQAVASPGSPGSPGSSGRPRTGIGTSTVPGTVTAIRHAVELDTHERLPADTPGSNDLGECEIATHRTVAFEAYEANRDTGGSSCWNDSTTTARPPGW